jgi:hypothetical protein
MAGISFAPIENIILTAAAGSYAFTGTAATLRVARILTAAPATYAFTGTAPSLERGYEIAADAASYLFMGTAATFRATRILTAEAVSYVFTGTAASLERGYKIAADAVSYLFTGSSAALLPAKVPLNLADLTVPDSAILIVQTEVTALTVQNTNQVLTVNAATTELTVH